MPQIKERDRLVRAYMLHMMLRDTLLPPWEQVLEDQAQQLSTDMETFRLLRNTRYISPRDHVPKSGILHLAWEYAENPNMHGRFHDMLRVSPYVFSVILELIKDHPVFHNNSNVPQAPVDHQLAVTLFRLGRYGNGAAIHNIALDCGVSEGSVENYTRRCFDAIETFHDVFVRPLTLEEKEVEKCWIDRRVGYRGDCRNGYCTHDGTLVDVFARPDLNGDAYFSRKSTYALNVQIGNCVSNLRIIDYSHGHTGSAHDANAFEGTCASKHPEFLFGDQEFTWADSAYPLSPTCIPIHKKPAALRPENIAFDKFASKIRVRSEHCMGALKGRFQCLNGLRVNIGSNDEHIAACRWITIAIILHNLIIDVEGSPAEADAGGELFDEEAAARQVEPVEEEEDYVYGDAETAGEAKRMKLTAEILAFQGVDI